MVVRIHVDGSAYDAVLLGIEGVGTQSAKDNRLLITRHDRQHFCPRRGTRRAYQKAVGTELGIDAYKDHHLPGHHTDGRRNGLVGLQADVNRRIDAVATTSGVPSTHPAVVSSDAGVRYPIAPRARGVISSAHIAGIEERLAIAGWVGGLVRSVTLARAVLVLVEFVAGSAT